MHETNIRMTEELWRRIQAWRPNINVSGECTRILREYVTELETMSPDQLANEKRSHRPAAALTMRVTYPESLAERLKPFKPHINISAICCEGLEDYLDALDELPDDLQARLKDVPKEET